jgi:hypothetical protein
MQLQAMRYDEHFGEVMRVMTGRGLLLTSASPSGKANSMIIGWGQIGSVWGKPVWTIHLPVDRADQSVHDQRARGGHGKGLQGLRQCFRQGSGQTG